LFQILINAILTADIEDNHCQAASYLGAWESYEYRI
jgi:hypothetical protein